MYLLQFFLTLRDRIDERRAIRRRDRFGRRRWLLSWGRADAPDSGATGRGPWLARLSCPELPLTVERRGRSLRQAIGRAEAALTFLLSPPEAPPDRRTRRRKLTRRG